MNRFAAGRVPQALGMWRSTTLTSVALCAKRFCHSRPQRRGWQIATAAVLLAGVGLADRVGAADPPRRIGAGGVSLLAIDPRASATLYAQTECGGMLKSTDGGVTWIVANIGLTGAVIALAIDPETPGTLYAGSGGVYKSTDGATSWLPAGSSGLTGAVIALAIDPATRRTLYVGTDFGGVYKSTDGAMSWQSGLSVSRSGVSALVIDPTAPSTLYAGTQNDGVFKSADGATTWQAAKAGLPAPSYIYALAIDPTTTRTLYAGTWGGGIYKSTDGAISWQAAGLTGFKIIALATDPATPGTLYAGTGIGVYKSTDGANSWSGIDAGLGLHSSANVTVAIDPTTPSTLYAGIDQPDGGGGVFKSTNRGGTWGATGLTRDPICGDGLRCGDEQCDDGNSVNGDGCDANCTLPRCGNGILDAGEQCDDGNSINGDGCDVNCTLPRCGNGILDPGEECDDGNTSNADPCRNDCKRNVCGDGFLNPATEECDDGNLINGDSCENDCTLPRCGNGILDAGEECDDGNRNPFDGCTNSCTICGNGKVTPPEECDDGNTNPFDGCTNGCTICGNGVVTAPESCDDGNLVNGDGCDANCVAPGVCGNAVTDGDEDCDDGGVCVGGANAGDFCTADTQCPGGACKTFGGDGCAANCTTESDVAFSLVPGARQDLDIAPGTSGTVIHGEILTFPLPSSGRQTLTIGKERNGQIPVVIKAAGVHLAPVPLELLGCFCPRAVAAKTCGGTILEPDGVTRSPDCTPHFTAGDSVCQGRNPCAFVHGRGNSASGVIGCNGLDGVNVSITQDGGGASGVAQPPLLTSSGTGASGSAILSASTAIGGFFHASGFASVSPADRCTGQDASVYGPDGELCTDDDPQSQRGAPLTEVVTTGTVTGQLLNANQTDGDNIGPFTATGAPFRCGALQRGDASGAALVSTLTELNRPTIGDVVFTSALVASASGPCAGDCDGGGDVAVTEVIAMINIALGTPGSCPSGVPAGAPVDIGLLIEAIHHALNGCGGG